MQTATLEASTLPVTDWEGLPYWVRLPFGIILIGMGASILAMQLRAAFPTVDDPASKARRRYLHYLYTPTFSVGAAAFVPLFLPGFDLGSRILIGIIAPVIWAPLYDIYKKRYGSDLGLPDAKDIIGNGTPKGGPTP